MSTDPTQRFSNRVEDYVKYRPGYPAEIVSYLQQQCDFAPGQFLADIGAGTGISTELFLEAGYKVAAVEPNKEMREKAISLLRHYPGFSAVDGQAEDTGLAAASVDAIIAGQAFHWFEVPATKIEFKRILKEGGIVALIWNERLTDSAFEQDYDELIKKYGRSYVELNHRNIDLEHIRSFFNPHPVKLDCFPNRQVFDFDGLKGRLLSSSYMPVAGEESYEAMLQDLKRLFDQYETAGRITIQYSTKVYTGTL